VGWKDGRLNAQETVDRLALLAKPRLATLLRLSTARHIYDPLPGTVNSESMESGDRVVISQWQRGQQPYKDLERFLAEERVMQSVIDPGLLPIAKAIARDVLGRRILVTRRIAAKQNDRGAIAHVEGYGIRVLLYEDSGAGDTIVAWECLYGVA
jgi:hypothetical protein